MGRVEVRILSNVVHAVVDHDQSGVTQPSSGPKKIPQKVSPQRFIVHRQFPRMFSDTENKLRGLSRSRVPWAQRLVYPGHSG